MAQFPITWLEVFAEAALQGNLHAVVHQADPIATSTMAAFATRMRLSETSYVQSPTEASADYLHRIFTVAGEIPFAGHPSLGTAAAVALAKGLSSARLAQQTLAGIQHLTVDLKPDGSQGTVEIMQNPPEHLGNHDSKPVLEALGLEADDGHPTLPATVISTGLPTLILPVRDVGVLSRPSPDLALLFTALDSLGHNVITCYVVANLGEGAWRARCFTPQVASGEDAATGSAAGPLTAFASRELGQSAIVIDQGIEMGSPSRLYGRVDGGAVIVSGSVRIIGQGTIELPVLAG
ncbi:MAG: PhzF family phenazine biosynthesis protein [Acidimicrobiales bacterium]